MRHLQSYIYVNAIAKAGSIRAAAETLAITPSALNRRVLALEEELGVPIFERLARGVRLSAAGELLIQHIRNQLSDMERVKSQIADLSGMRRGHVSIACSQALLPFFLPEQISAYRRVHPGVTFGVHLRDRAAAEQALADHSADIALVFEPVRMRDFQTILTVRQPVYAMMAHDHPLAGRETLRLRDCLAYPVALPSASYGVRHLLELAVLRSSLNLRRLEPAVESDSFEFLRRYAETEDLISFQILIGLSLNSQPASSDPQVPRARTGKAVPAQDPSGQGLRATPIDTRDVPEGLLYMGQLRGRTLPVAAARFVDQLAKALQEGYP